ncbi:hypothetical protein Tco_0968745 [Tanacetum coccineum]
MPEKQALKGSKSSCGNFDIAKSWITCVNTNRNTTLSEAQGVSLQITSGVRGLRMADSHTGNHPEDDFTPLETIRRSNSTIRKKIPFELEGEAFELGRRSYASGFADSVFQDDDDSRNRIEPGSHKERPKTVDDDDENEKEKKDDKKDDDENKDDVKDKDNDDHTDQLLTNEMIKEAVPRLVDLAVERDRETAPTNLPNTILNLYPATSSSTATTSTATTSTADIQHQLYLTMKINLQDQAIDPELWEILKAKFNKS